MGEAAVSVKNGTFPHPPTPSFRPQRVRKGRGRTSFPPTSILSLTIHFTPTIRCIVYKTFIVEIAFCITYNTYMLFTIGEQIKNERKLRKLSQHKGALDLGMSRTTISLIESGSVQDIGVRKLIRILEYLGLELRVRPAGVPPTLDELREVL